MFLVPIRSNEDMLQEKKCLRYMYEQRKTLNVNL